MVTEHDARNRWPITVSIMLAALMNSLDSTIANVALPHIQGSVSASAEQVTWVLTSYIVASAIMTPLAGWLAGRLGRKRVFMISIAGFTLTSMLCGAATSLPEIVVFRVLQGLCGASLMPLSQATLLDINPPQRHGQAMAIWGAGVVVGSVMGPAVGGFFTEVLSWRWCFYINLPIGIIAFLGVWLFVSGDRLAQAKRFDFLGFGMLTLFVGAMQLVLDRGPGQDWFQSREIWTEAILAIIGLWVFAIHTLTTPHPFFDRSFLRDRNFVTACIFGFFVGGLLFSSLALLPPMMQVLLGYPVITSGLLSMSRGVGSFLAMFAVARLVGPVGIRPLMLGGLVMNTVALWQMSQFDLAMTSTPFVTAGLMQGFGVGLIFTPLTVLAFVTVPPHLRPEGSSVYTLVRNMGSSVGISVMNALVVANTQGMHGSLAARLVPSDPVVRAGLPSMFNPTTTAGLSALNAEVTRQASMVAYVDDFRLMLIISILCAPMLLFMRKPNPSSREPLNAVAE